ncbi:hypothetical protein HPP92_009267 [Vanilla planifolia]|uniref:Uncharacterized protein n=1 Tax=Vanilla planifolia TaxID=51239 RepID=A0A835RFC7_VANPL|nr:hypothetical protein HPP92_009467 [Vanilla planifolia]KAG0487172.1 hypothetical protein HPP92_009267 [Vanilla planifolia]
MQCFACCPFGQRSILLPHSMSSSRAPDQQPPRTGLDQRFCHQILPNGVGKVDHAPPGADAMHSTATAAGNLHAIRRSGSLWAVEILDRKEVEEFARKLSGASSRTEVRKGMAATGGRHDWQWEGKYFVMTGQNRPCRRVGIQGQEREIVRRPGLGDEVAERQ